MKIDKKSIYVVFVSVLVFSSIPNYTLAIETFADYFPLLTEVNNGEYMLVYERDWISNEVVYEQALYSRNIKKTPTEFQTIEIEDTYITPWTIDFDGFEVRLNRTALVTFGDTTYLFGAAEGVDTGNLTFVATETSDNGATWEEVVVVQNTTIPFDDFFCFDVTYRGSNLYLAYSYDSLPDRTQIVNIDPISYGILSETLAGDYFGFDFKLYPATIDAEERIYITSTEPGLMEEVRVTYTLTGVDFFPVMEMRIEAPEKKTEDFNPTMIWWEAEEKFFLVAQDKLTDEYNPAQNITFDEYYLWGASFDDVDDTSVDMHMVVKDVADGYFRKDPSLETYEGRIFLSYQVGEGSRFGSGGTPDITFAFSADAQVWTKDFIGKISIFLNPGSYFVIATLGCFALAIPSIIFYNRFKKGK